jgi:hypothetical protein
MKKAQAPLQFTLCVALAAAGTHTASAQDSLKRGLAHCAAIAGRDERLACFDALAAQGGAAQAAAQTTTATPGGAEVSTPPAGQAPGKAAASAGPADNPADFGLNPALKVPAAKTMAITARVTAVTRTREGAEIVLLDNGQSWELEERDPLLAAGDAVTIRRGTLGSFMLTTPTSRSHKAHRTL